MKYTVYVEASFDDKKDADELMAIIEKKKAKSYKPTKLEKIDMVQKAELWETHHDEDPPKQCKKLESVVF